MLHFTHLQNSNDKSIMRDKNELVHVKCLEQCLAWSQALVQCSHIILFHLLQSDRQCNSYTGCVSLLSPLKRFFLPVIIVPLVICVLSKLHILLVRASHVPRIIQVLDKQGGQAPDLKGMYVLFGGDKQLKPTQLNKTISHTKYYQYLRMRRLF